MIALIKGYDGDYAVTDDGCVISYKNKEIQLRNETNNGYCAVHLCKNGVRKRLFVHRLVYESFVGEIPEGNIVDHINGIKTDNRSTNLRLSTIQENACSARGNINGRSKYRGVHIRKDGMFIASITYKKQRKWIGSFEREELAADAWNEAALKIGFKREALNKITK